MSQQLFQLSSSISKIIGVVFLRSMDGSRVYSKYYTKNVQQQLLRVNEGLLSSIEVQKEFEKNVWEKGKRVGSRLARGSESEIFQYCQFNVVMKAFNEVQMFVFADFEENEVLLAQVSQTVFESLSIITKEHVSKKTILDNFDLLIVIIDEILDEGIIVNLDAQVIVARSTMRDCDAVNVEKSEPAAQGGGFGSVFASAKRQFAQQFMGGQ